MLTFITLFTGQRVFRTHSRCGPTVAHDPDALAQLFSLLRTRQCLVAPSTGGVLVALGRGAETPGLARNVGPKKLWVSVEYGLLRAWKVWEGASSSLALHTLLDSRIGVRRMKYAVPLSGVLCDNHDLIIVALDVCPSVPQHST